MMALLNIIFAINNFLNFLFRRPLRRSQKKKPLLSNLINLFIFFQKIFLKKSFNKIVCSELSIKNKVFKLFHIKFKSGRLCKKRTSQ